MCSDNKPRYVTFTRLIQSQTWNSTKPTHARYTPTCRAQRECEGWHVSRPACVIVGPERLNAVVTLSVPLVEDSWSDTCLVPGSYAHPLTVVVPRPVPRHVLHLHPHSTRYDLAVTVYFNS